MIWYIIIFFTLFVTDNYKYKNRGVYVFLVACIAIFFCFGYMCGSDWNDYEYYYNHREFIGKDLEIGLNIVFRIFQFFNTDFWIVNSICKLFFFFVTINFYSLFTNRPFAVAGLGMVMTMCFMLISCPMRFMMAMAFFLLATKFYIERKRLYAFIFVIIASLFHMFIIPVAIIAVSAILFCHSFSSIKTRWLVLFYLGLYILLMKTHVTDNLFNSFLFLLLDSDELKAFALSYGDKFSISAFLSVGRLREIVSFLVIVNMRDSLLKNRYGHVIFYFAILSLFISPIIMGMSTMFRLNIFFYSFVDIALVIILYESFIKSRQLITLLRCVFISIIFVSMVRTITADYTFIPYTNSIPYIVSGHLPYSERLEYNKKAYMERTGHSYNNPNE